MVVFSYAGFGNKRSAEEGFSISSFSAMDTGRVFIKVVVWNVPLPNVPAKISPSITSTSAELLLSVLYCFKVNTGTRANQELSAPHEGAAALMLVVEKIPYSVPIIAYAEFPLSNVAEYTGKLPKLPSFTVKFGLGDVALEL